MLQVLTGRLSCDILGFSVQHGRFGFGMRFAEQEGSYVRGPDSSCIDSCYSSWKRDLKQSVFF